MKGGNCSGERNEEEVHSMKSALPDWDAELEVKVEFVRNRWWRRDERWMYNAPP